MRTYHLTISTPDGSMLSEEVSALFARGIEGDLAILAGHTPFVTTVKAGTVRVELADGSEKAATTDGGILSVSADSTTLLSGTFEWNNE
ncbi:MAG: hypothetical protein IJB48_05320 [Clostridia bacterium]|nr:hypothetical protein [Clostridia bacterium]MBQ3554025.1 hypothetical protein [Clostridia bacterium]